MKSRARRADYTSRFATHELMQTRTLCRCLIGLVFAGNQPNATAVTLRNHSHKYLDM